MILSHQQAIEAVFASEQFKGCKRDNDLAIFDSGYGEGGVAINVSDIVAIVIDEYTK